MKEEKVDTPKKDVGKYINKVGKSVMPSRKAEETKEKSEQNEKRYLNTIFFIKILQFLL